MKVAIIGGAGHLGSVIAKSILESNTCDPSDLFVYQRTSEKATAISKELGCKAFFAPSSDLLAADLVILSVKPQDFSAAALAYQKFINSDSLVVSVMAGVSLDSIVSCWPGARAYIRTMPNLPVKIGKGVVAYFSSQKLSAADIQLINELFSSNARLLKVSSESLINAATAISGSGPAYFFRLGLALQEAAKALGFSAEEAKVLVEQTAWGSAAYWEHSALHAEDLIRQVRSKRGTTDAALNSLDKAAFDTLIMQAVNAATLRATELSEEISANNNSNYKRH